jgi:hypothetical protein
MKLKTLGLAALAVAMYAIPAFAHHSFAMFDGNKKITLQGTVKEFLWTYPHAWIVIIVDEGGQQKQWSLELPGPSNLARNGWVPKSLTPGMKISTVAHPLKNGQAGGAAVEVTLPDGKKLEV